MPPRSDLAEIGAALRAQGLTERAVCLCFGVYAVAHAPRAARAAANNPLPPAAVLPRLFAGGEALPRVALEACLGGARVDALERAGLVEVAGAQVSARHLLLPVGESLIACDPPGPGARAPDDSAFHLLGALGRRRVERWLDVGTGTAIAPLARRGLGREVRGSDVDPVALDLAELGASLSGATELELRRADLLDAAAGRHFDLVTFNAPLPEQGGLDLLRRFWRRVPAVVTGAGEVVVHSAIPDPTRPFPQVPGGELRVALYTPRGAAAHFGVTRWRPAGPGRQRLSRVTLRVDRPHVRLGDLET